MKLQELFEAATDELYHFTRLSNAATILENGYFKLAASVGTGSERQFQKSGKFYYFSTTRSKVGDYTLHGYHLDGVVFNLNGRYLNTKYTSKPVDYWERMWAGRPGRSSEAEDRVYSTEPTLPIPKPATKLIESIHILYEIEKIKSDDQYNRLLWLRKTLLGAKKLGIPVHVYATPKDWLTQNPAKRIDLKSLVSTMSTQPPKPSWGRTKRDYFKVWRELYFKNKKEDLSKDANKLLYKIDVYSRDAITGLDADIHNAKTSNDPGLIKLLKIFRQLKINSPTEYIKYLNNKWTKIEDEAK
jgi:hypothetical protein